MRTKALLISLIAIFAISFSSCNYTMKTMKTPNNYVEFKKDDFTFSEQVVGRGAQTKVFGIDWSHLFVSKTGSIQALPFSFPIIGNLPIAGSEAYAIWDLMEKNGAGYDVVFYPQYETQIKGVPFIFQKSTTTVKARLAKIK